MAKRTGMPAITALAKEMCRLITKFTPIIRIATNDSAPVLIALETALAACSALEEALSEHIEQGV